MHLDAFFVAAAAVAVALVWGRLARARPLRAALASAERHAQALERELQSLRRTHLQLVDDHQFLGQFLRSLPTLTRSLLGGASEREIPDLLVGALRRELGGSRGVGLPRRGPPPRRP